MIRRPPRSTRTDTLFPYTTLFRSVTSSRRRAWHRPASTPPSAPPTRSLMPAHSPKRRDCGGRCSHQLCCRSEEHTSELQSLMRISYAVFCLKKKKKQTSVKTTNIKISETTTKICYNDTHKH